MTGTVREPVYAYDRIVIPVGTRVRGHVSAIDTGSKFVRARAYMSGNLSPDKHAVLTFDALLLDDGVERPIETIVKGGFPNIKRSVAGGEKPAPTDSDNEAKPTVAQRGKTELRQQTTAAVDGAKQKCTTRSRRSSHWGNRGS